VDWGTGGAYPKGTSYNVIGLKKNRAYTFTVKARGDGKTRKAEWGEWSTSWTPTTAPVGAATISVHSKSVVTILAQFTPHADAVAYKYRYKSLDDPDAQWTVVAKQDLPEDGPAPLLRAGGLQEHTAYRIAVQLFGDGKSYTAGPGPWAYVDAVTYRSRRELESGTVHCFGEGKRELTAQSDPKTMTRPGSHDDEHDANIRMRKSIFTVGSGNTKNWRGCSALELITTSEPGADSITWRGNGKINRMRLPSDFDPDTDLEGKTKKQDFHDFYEETSPVPTHESGSSTESVYNECSDCRGATHKMPALDSMRQFFKNYVHHGFGFHTYGVGTWSGVHRTHVRWELPQRVLRVESTTDIGFVYGELLLDLNPEEVEDVISWLKGLD